jgi:hypothetical protein
MFRTQRQIAVAKAERDLGLMFLIRPLVAVVVEHILLGLIHIRGCPGLQRKAGLLLVEMKPRLFDPSQGEAVEITRI